MSEVGRLRRLELAAGCPLATALPALVLVSSLIVHGETIAASDKPAGSAVGLPRVESKAARNVPYVSMGMAIVRPEGARFVDGDDSGQAALYGSEGLFDAGAFDTGRRFHLAAGIRFRSGIRAQLEVGPPRAFDWRGNTNYRNGGKLQPSEATLDSWQLVLAGLYDLPGWTLGSGRTARPYLGVGAGVTRYRVTAYVQQFPDPDDPTGYLRRGPEGEIPFTAVPDGTGRTFTWTLTAGIAIPVRESVHLDLSYRYTDMGKIETDAADVTIVRYRADGTRREIRVPINATAVDHRTHTLAMSFRFDL
ncbi:MAG: outer membrane beta-barrel protein [Gammaproteobacteria bacterium]|nr:outer membrane beta-barrel protein [Gammaproteobacteria bacterium]